MPNPIITEVKKNLISFILYNAVIAAGGGPFLAGLIASEATNNLAESFSKEHKCKLYGGTLFTPGKKTEPYNHLSCHATSKSKLLNDQLDETFHQTFQYWTTKLPLFLAALILLCFIYKIFAGVKNTPSPELPIKRPDSTSAAENHHSHLRRC